MNILYIHMQYEKFILSINIAKNLKIKEFDFINAWNAMLLEIPIKNPLQGKGFGCYVTESEGFEPSIELPLYSISSAAPSTTRPALHRLLWGRCQCSRAFPDGWHEP